MAKEKETPQTEEEIFALSDIDVDTVGLVERGAVGEDFFLIKNEGGQNMTEEIQVDNEPGTDMDNAPGDTAKSVLEKLGMGAIVDKIQELVPALVKEHVKQELAETPAEEDEENTMAEKEKTVTLETPVVEEAPEAVDNVSKADFDAAIEKANNELKERTAALEKALEEANAKTTAARAIATAEREKRELREWVAKAEEYDQLPIGADELGSYLYKVEKWDNSTTVELAKADDYDAEKDAPRYLETLTELLKAANAQIKEGQLFAQKGDTRAAAQPTDLIKWAEKRVEEGKAETIVEAIKAAPVELQEKDRANMRK